MMNFYIHRINLKINQVQLQEQYHLNLPEVAKIKLENGPQWEIEIRATKLNKTKEKFI